MVDVFAVIPAAGSGSRMGTKVKKQYLQICGLPVLVHTLAVFEDCPAIKGIVLVVGRDEVLWCQQQIVSKYNFQKLLAVVPGGDCRQHSVYNGLKALPAKADDVVAVHDGARPLVTGDILLNAVSAAQQKGSAVVAVPVKDTVKLADADGQVLSTPPRDRLWAVQTPQVFKYSLLLNAYQQAEQNNYFGTDDASLVEEAGQAVHLVRGSYENIKITTPEDILLAEEILKRRKANCE